MPIFHYKKKKNKQITYERFFFIHIPRTAGKFLLENFLKNGYKIEHHLTKKIIEEKEIYLESIPEGIDIIHLHYSLYSKWKNIKGLPFIAVIRNPIDRFFSTMCRPIAPLTQSSFEDWTSFKNIITEYISTGNTNWWRPQHEFVSSHTKTWRYENGFGKKFCDWINTILSTDFSIKTHTGPELIRVRANLMKRSPRATSVLMKTKPLIDNIKKFYHKDFEDFNYQIKD